jgi:hypothetical protein
VRPAAGGQPPRTAGRGSARCAGCGAVLSAPVVVVGPLRFCAAPACIEAALSGWHHRPAPAFPEA